MAKKKQFNKSEFVRGMPNASAKDVVDAARKKGVRLTDRYVYVIRSSDKRKGLSRGSRKVKGNPSASSHESALRQSIAEIGLTEARRIFSEVEATFSVRSRARVVKRRRARR